MEEERKTSTDQLRDWADKRATEAANQLNQIALAELRSTVYHRDSLLERSRVAIRTPSHLSPDFESDNPTAERVKMPTLEATGPLLPLNLPTGETTDSPVEIQG